jgi:hypothetical protein
MILRPEVLAPAVFLVGFLLGFGTRSSISWRRQRRAQSAYRPDEMSSSAWRLQPPPARAALTAADVESLRPVADAPAISGEANEGTGECRHTAAGQQPNPLVDGLSSSPTSARY